MNLKFNILIANKMVKYTEAICWLLLKDCWSLFHHFVELALKGLVARIIRRSLTDTQFI